MLCHVLKANRVKWGPLLPAEHMNMETLADEFTCPGDVTVLLAGFHTWLFKTDI